MFLNKNIKIFYEIEFRRTIRSFFYPFRFILNYKKFLNLYKFLDRYKFPDNILVIGGGNSNIKNIPLGKFKIMVLNRFHNSDLAKFVIPDFYFVLDPFFFNNFNEFDKVLKYISSNKCKLVLPIGLNERVEKFIKEYEIDEIIYIESSFSRVFGGYSPFVPRCYSGMSLLSMIVFALALQAKKIYLIGFLSDLYKYLNVDKYNNSMLTYPSFGHINGSIIKQNVSEFLFWQSIFFSDLNEISKKYPNRIFNLDENSSIDSFEKVTLE